MEKNDILARLLSIKSIMGYIFSMCNDLEKAKNEYNLIFNDYITFFEYSLNLNEKNDLMLKLADEIKKIDFQINELNNLMKMEEENNNKFFKKDVVLLSLSEQKNICDLYSKKKNEEIDNIKNRITQLTLQKEKIQKNKELYVDNKESIIKSHNKAITNLNKIAKIKQGEINLLLKKVNITYKSLCDHEREFLHYKDFDKVERLYYYIETGRADTIKEALNLVDSQIRHEEVIAIINQAILSFRKAIHDMTNEIIDAVNINSFELCSTINNGFMSTNEELMMIKDSINDLDDTISAGYSTIIKQNEGLLDSVKLQNSLIESENNTCEEILKKYKYINGLSGEV